MPGPPRYSIPDLLEAILGGRIHSFPSISQSVSQFTSNQQQHKRAGAHSNNSLTRSADDTTILAGERSPHSRQYAAYDGPKQSCSHFRAFPPLPLPTHCSACPVVRYRCVEFRIIHPFSRIAKSQHSQQAASIPNSSQSIIQ